ncbi:VapA/VapB family virulence-associated protein [Lysinibacter sp. HNR]|uniref:VapA/VapB family virulence-associated protein n=1 Tax=Lysinibacter sp. HNR TaxID=3031408 RepID=UPI0024356A09|nr:VapA/VapB family virulence-associated protein [Lysinibacter sp. HNR]WGD37275.1 VapA/VapB family virulence-associated protein [Lysinibacter sp. HNR]
MVKVSIYFKHRSSEKKMRKTLRYITAGIALICSIGLASPAIATPTIPVQPTTVENTNTPYSCQEESEGASGEVVLALFYGNVRVKVKNRTFVGHSGGFGIGGGYTIGKVFAHCGFDNLFSNTKSFQVNNAAGVVNILFYGPGSQLLGTFVGGNIGLGVGIFGGSGDWNN